jgi:hypothetical protein
VNTITIDWRTTWAVLVMEGALVLPIISLPSQGDRMAGLAGPLLLLLLLPLGYVAVFQFATLRDPSWRLLTGIGLGLATRLVVSTVPDDGPQGLLVWFGRSVVPVVIGIGLWWRGGALAVAELTPYDVRTEFSVLAICLLATLALVRPFVLPDPLLLGICVGLFAVGGLIATALARQDAAQVAAPRSRRLLAIGSGLVPVCAALVLVGSLRPALLTTMWLLVARAIELALTPVGLLVSWLSSLFPPVVAGPLPTPVPQPTPQSLDPAALAAAQERLAWIGPLIVISLLLLAGLGAIVAARLLLENFIIDPRQRAAAATPQEDLLVEAEASGTPQDEAADLLGWLMGWLRDRFGRRARARAGHMVDSGEPLAVDAWAAYQRLLGWAERRGMSRHPSETTGQLSARLADRVPEAAEAIDVVTTTYEWDRYGARPPRGDLLRRMRDALMVLLDRE